MARRLFLGVISDVHLRRPGDEDILRKTLEYFRDREVDGVIVAGDLVDVGRYEPLKRFADTWFGVFPNDRAPDGRHVHLRGGRPADEGPLPLRGASARVLRQEGREDRVGSRRHLNFRRVPAVLQQFAV